MSVGLFYNTVDLPAFKSAIQAAAQVARGTDRTNLNRINAAIGPDVHALPNAHASRQQNDPDTRRVVLPEQCGDLTAVLALLERSWSLDPPATDFLLAIWKDAQTSAIDPYVAV
jgi:hypothetical protein